MKLLKNAFQGILVIVVLSCCILASCSNDEPNNSKLCGTWQNQAFIYHFDEGGSGYFQYSPTNGLYDVHGVTKSYFTWKATASMLSITFDGSGVLSAGTSTYYYEVDESLLVIISMNSGETDSFTKR